MSDEEKIKSDLENKFGFLKDKVTIKRDRRMSAEVNLDMFPEVFDYLVTKIGFSILCTITGLDEGTSFGLIYHLSRDNKIVLNLKTSLQKEKPVIGTITNYFPAADIYEREVMDLFGIEVSGLPPGHRYPLHDNWPADEYPLRKDWKQGGCGTVKGG